MKFRKFQINDYRSSAFIGGLLIFMGLGSLLNGKDTMIAIITIIGAIGLIGQSIYQYKQNKKIKQS